MIKPEINIVTKCILKWPDKSVADKQKELFAILSTTKIT